MLTVSPLTQSSRGLVQFWINLVSADIRYVSNFLTGTSPNSAGRFQVDLQYFSAVMVAGAAIVITFPSDRFLHLALISLEELLHHVSSTAALVCHDCCIECASG